MCRLVWRDHERGRRTLRELVRAKSTPNNGVHILSVLLMLLLLLLLLRAAPLSHGSHVALPEKRKDGDVGQGREAGAHPRDGTANGAAQRPAC